MRDAMKCFVIAVDSRCRESKSLTEVLFLKERVLEEDGGVVRVAGHEFKDAPDGDAHAADARLATTLSGFNRDAV